MKITYSEKYDILYIGLREATIDDSDEHTSGFVMDLDADGRMVGLEILDASKYVDDPRRYATILDPSDKADNVEPTPRATA